MSLKAALDTAMQIRRIHQEALLLDGLSHFPERLRLEIPPQDMLELAERMCRLHDHYQEVLANIPPVDA